jgi:serine/threonine protein kinase
VRVSDPDRHCFRRSLSPADNVWLDHEWRGVLGDLGESRQLQRGATTTFDATASAGDDRASGDAERAAVLPQPGAPRVAPHSPLPHSSPSPAALASAPAAHRPAAPPLTMDKGTTMYQAPELRSGRGQALERRLQQRKRGSSVAQSPRGQAAGGRSGSSAWEWCTGLNLPLCFLPLPPRALAGVLGLPSPAHLRGLGVPTGTSRTPPGLPYGTSSDVFAMGCLLWELLTGGRPFVPFAGAEGARSLVLLLSGDLHARPPIPATTPLAYAHLVRCAWHPVAERRPTAAVIAAVLQRLLAAAEAAVRGQTVDLRSDCESADTASRPERECSPTPLRSESDAPLDTELLHEHLSVTHMPEAQHRPESQLQAPESVVWRGWSSNDSDTAFTAAASLPAPSVHGDF